MLWITGAWVAANLLWLWEFRRARLFEFDESGYASLAVSLARQRTLSGVWSTLHQGNQGPLQAILATPTQWIHGRDPATLLWQNVLFGAGTAVVVYLMTRRLAGRRPALVAGVLVLLAPGMIEYSRLALTVMPSVFFGSVAMAALVAGLGLERARWVLVAGVAAGCMTLSRSMTIGFLPALAVAAGGWAYSRRTPLRTLIRNGALAAVGALGVAAWWWILRWADVSDYLFGGGSADTAQMHNPILKASIHIGELFAFLGLAAPILGLLAYLVLRFWVGRRDRAEPGPVDDGSANLAVWPVWAAVATGIAALSVVGAFGVGFALPLAPWAVAAGVALVARTLDGRRWRIWVAVVVVGAIVPAILIPGPALHARLAWCTSDVAKDQCEVKDNATGVKWREAVAAVADRIWVAYEATGGDPKVALNTRDFLVNGNTIGLALELRYSTGIDFTKFFNGGGSKAEELEQAIRGAGLVVSVDDYRPGDIIFGTDQPAPKTVVAAAWAAGFVRCDVVDLPDGRKATILAAKWVPKRACE